MSFGMRSALSVLAGIGAGVVGFYSVWRCLIGSTFQSVPGPGYDEWLVAGIFVPGVAVAAVVFRQISLATTRPAAAPPDSN
jgi:hypothetical protein